MTPEPKPGDVRRMVRIDPTRMSSGGTWLERQPDFPDVWLPRSSIHLLPPTITPTEAAVVTAAMAEQEAHKLLVPRAERYMLPRESWTPTAKALWRACEAHAATLPKPDPKREAVERALAALDSAAAKIYAASPVDHGAVKECEAARADLEAAFREGGK